MIPNPISKAILVTAATFSPFTLHAATWLGGTANYTSPGEWDTGLAPAATENITINAGQATHTGNLSRNAVTNISGTGSLSVQNGRFISGGTVNVSDSAILTVVGNYFLVGNTSVGTLIQTGGNVSATVDRGFFLSDAAAQGGSSYNLLGGTLQVVNNGTDSNIDLFAVHFGKGGVGDVFTIDGGTATFESVTANRNVWMSRGSTFRLISGSVSFSSYDNFTIGHGGNASSTSHLWIEGGDFEVISLLNGFTLGGLENGLLTLDGGNVEIAASILLGGAAGTSGTFIMNDGLLTANGISAGSGDALFEFNGGEIILTGDQTNIVNEPWFDEVAGTQAVYDTQTNLTHVTVVPEPSSLALLTISLAAFAGNRKRKVRHS
jgi:hypothetical protein